MLHTVKTTCAISALLVSFAATAHAANVVSDPYASYVDCSYGQAKISKNSGCTARGQQVSVSALSQMMALGNVNANLATDINNLTLNADDENGMVQYERGTERDVDGKDREVKQLVFLIDNRPKGDKEPKDKGGRGADGRPVGSKDIRDPNGRLIKDGRDGATASSWSSDGTTKVYKIDLSDEAAAQIEKAIPRKKEKNEGGSPASRSADGRVATAKEDGNGWDDDDRMDVVMPLAYASPAEIKAEEDKVKVKAAPAAKQATHAGTASDGGAVSLVKPTAANQNDENVTFKVMLVNYSQTSTDQTFALRVYNASTSETITVVTLRADAPVVYRVREIAPVTRDLAQGGTSATPGENVRDQSYSGTNNTPSGSANQPEPMDKDNPESGKGGSGTFL